MTSHRHHPATQLRRPTPSSSMSDTVMLCVGKGITGKPALHLLNLKCGSRWTFRSRPPLVVRSFTSGRYLGFSLDGLLNSLVLTNLVLPRNLWQPQTQRKPTRNGTGG